MELDLKGDGVALDLTGRVFSGAFKDGEGNPLITPECTFTNPTGGTMVIHLSAAQNNFTVDTDCEYEFTISDPDGDFIFLEGEAHFQIHVPGDEMDMEVETAGTFYSHYDITTSENLALNLDDYTASCRFRSNQNSLTVFKSPTCRILGSQGIVAIVMSVLETPELPVGTYWYDLYLTNGVDAFRVVQGELEIVSS